MSSRDELISQAAARLAKAESCDVYFYNGEIGRRYDLEFIRTMYSAKASKSCKLLVVTNGGDPDAAYKMARYAQESYERVTILVSGLCKSAGTLMAIGGHEVAFSRYGELGPLDVQTFKEDKISGLQSGLNISEALQALEHRASITYNHTIDDILKSSGGILSFPTAAKAATDLVAALYQPIFAQIDPEDVGNRTRSMRIAIDYGERLNAFSQNLKSDALKRLAEYYSSHSFVIDMVEAMALFHNVREANEHELELVESLGISARMEVRNTGQPTIKCLSAGEASHGPSKTKGSKKTSSSGANRRNSPQAGKATGAKAASTKGTSKRRRTEKVVRRASANGQSSV